MLSRVNTVAFNGLEILDVDLQVQISSGLPAFTIVGLPDKAVAESRERVRAALQSLGLSLPGSPSPPTRTLRTATGSVRPTG